MGKKRQREPGRTFVFRIVPEGNPTVWRTVELTEKQTLHHLHGIIQKAFDLKGKHLYAFYLSGKQWDTDTEYGGPSTGSQRKANKAALGKLQLDRDSSFLYLRDFESEQRFHVEWTEERRITPKVTYPKVLEAHGELPPPRTPLIEALPAPMKTFALRLKATLETWALTRPKPRGPKDLGSALELVAGIQRFLESGGQEAWCLLEEATEFLLVDWLLSLPEDLARRNMIDEALSICDTFSPYAEEIYFSCEKALVLAWAGRREKALQEVRSNLTRSPEDPRVVARAAEVFWKLDEVGHAERLFRKALDLAADNINERAKILKRLVAMLEENERFEEAVELVHAEMDRG